MIVVCEYIGRCDHTSTGSHQKSAVKRAWARIVLGWETSWEVLVLYLFYSTSFLPVLPVTDPRLMSEILAEFQTSTGKCTGSYQTINNKRDYDRIMINRLMRLVELGLVPEWVTFGSR
ncbi:hypothetical protein PIB30_067979 [Stylosanthes scabra]|uniref:Uncharacterized protein n=1 Tax=Stylosanthes scabra TaxID=79078 RepID=A0ABU6WMP0_9FABA|nr:hypothetical protein [Stylosanthes scabra]